jgi:hypothetical protein
MSCSSCKNKELNQRDDINKILNVEFINQHDLETTMYLYKLGYRLAENEL